LWLAGSPASTAARRFSPNDKLNIGVIGVANRGAENLHGVANENIVALCDIDDKLLAAAAQRFPFAKPIMTSGACWTKKTSMRS